MEKECKVFLEKKINLFALALCGALCGSWWVIVAQKYYFIDSGGSDTALHVQTLWSIAHGRVFNSLLDANFLVEHCAFLSFLLAPFYGLCPDPVLLQYCKVTAFFIGAYLFFLILKKRLHPWIALAGMFVFTVAPANVGMLLFSFNYEPFSIPLIFLIFKAYDDKNYKGYLAGCFFLALVKEQMPLVVMMFGAAALFKREQRIKWALVPLVMGVVIFILEVFVLIPYVRRGLPSTGIFYWSRYEQFGHTPFQAGLFLLTHPIHTLQYLVSDLNIRWYKDLFDVGGTFGLLSPQMLLPALPLFIKTLFSNKIIEHNPIDYYYGATFTPFIFMAAWNTLQRVPNRWSLTIHGLVIAGMFIHAVSFMPHWLVPREFVGGEANLLSSQMFMGKIPINASVITGDSTLTPLASRAAVYQFDTYLWGYYQISGIKVKGPMRADYLLLNFSEYDRLFFTENSKEFIARIAALNFSGQWELKGSLEDTALFVRNVPGEKTDRLVEKSDKPFLVSRNGPLSYDHSVSLEGLAYPAVFPGQGRIFPITMYWKCLNATDALYMVSVKVRSGKKVYYEKNRPVGYVIYPANFWHKGEYIKERYSYLLPHLGPGEYFIEIQFYNSQMHFYFPLIHRWLNCSTGKCSQGPVCSTEILQERFLVK